MNHIREYVKSKRPSLSESSITTYTSILKNLYDKVFKDSTYELKKFDDCEKVIDCLSSLPPNKRKTILSSLVIITDKKAYRDLMSKDVNEYKQQIDKQEKTPAQKEAWVNTNQVQEIFNDLKKNATLLYKKKQLTSSDLQEIQSFVIIALLSGIFINPRRSKDFVDFKIKNINKKTDNYLEKDKMYFNSYKTAKTYGLQIIEITDPELLKILKKWIKVNPTEWLLFDANMNQLSSVKLNQRLNKIFDKKVGVNQLRHTFLTDKYAHTISDKEDISNTMATMGSSSNMLDTYVKK
jgi:hypothetical protein